MLSSQKGIFELLSKGMGHIFRATHSLNPCDGSERITSIRNNLVVLIISIEDGKRFSLLSHNVQQVLSII